MTPDERASFLLGQALRRAMLDVSKTRLGRHDERRAHAWGIYSMLCADYLTDEEGHEIRQATGLVDMSDGWLPERRYMPD